VIFYPLTEVTTISPLSHFQSPILMSKTSFEPGDFWWCTSGRTGFYKIDSEIVINKGDLGLSGANVLLEVTTHFTKSLVRYVIHKRISKPLKEDEQLPSTLLLIQPCFTYHPNIKRVYLTNKRLLILKKKKNNC
jgi:hypothetical protein